VIGGVLGAMLMSLLVLRVLYLAFDVLARAAVSVLTQRFGIRSEQLAWLVGQECEEEFEENVARDRLVPRPSGILDEAHT
jgi:cobalt-zinc-cadmium resistance protein CzcA